MAVGRDFLGPSVIVAVASFCNITVSVLHVSFHPMAAAELPLPSLATLLAGTVSRRFAVAAQVSDHYLSAGDELSSSAHVIHPGELGLYGSPNATG
jgi:hypothetical protein